MIVNSLRTPGLQCYVVLCVKKSSWFFLLGNLIDVLRVLELSDRMEGVSLEAGLCTHRADTEELDIAFRIDKKIQLSAPTQQLFPSMHMYM